MDSIYFSNSGINVVAVEQVCDEIKFLNKNYADKLESLGFEILFKIEDKDLAPY